MKNKNFLKSLMLITMNRDFKLTPIIKIDQNFDLVKLNRKESHMKKIGLLITLLVMTMSAAHANYWTHTPYSD